MTKHRKLNKFLAAASWVLIALGLACLIVNFTVCAHAWIISAIFLPAGSLIQIARRLKPGRATINARAA